MNSMAVFGTVSFSDFRRSFWYSTLTKCVYMVFEMLCKGHRQ
jgi:hypothetical protein